MAVDIVKYLSPKDLRNLRLVGKLWNAAVIESRCLPSTADIVIDILHLSSKGDDDLFINLDIFKLNFKLLEERYLEDLQRFSNGFSYKLRIIGLNLFPEFSFANCSKTFLDILSRVTNFEEVPFQKSSLLDFRNVSSRLITIFPDLFSNLSTLKISYGFAIEIGNACDEDQYLPFASLLHQIKQLHLTLGHYEVSRIEQRSAFWRFCLLVSKNLKMLSLVVKDSITEIWESVDEERKGEICTIINLISFCRLQGIEFKLAECPMSVVMVICDAITQSSKLPFTRPVSFGEITGHLIPDSLVHKLEKFSTQLDIQLKLVYKTNDLTLPSSNCRQLSQPIMHKNITCLTLRFKKGFGVNLGIMASPLVEEISEGFIYPQCQCLYYNSNNPTEFIIYSKLTTLRIELESRNYNILSSLTKHFPQNFPNLKEFIFIGGSVESFKTLEAMKQLRTAINADEDKRILKLPRWPNYTLGFQEIFRDLGTLEKLLIWTNMNLLEKLSLMDYNIGKLEDNMPSNKLFEH